MNIRSRHWLSGLLSLIFPGLGQIYNSELAKGYSFMCLWLTLQIVAFVQISRYVNPYIEYIGLPLVLLRFCASIEAIKMFGRETVETVDAGRRRSGFIVFAVAVTAEIAIALLLRQFYVGALRVPSGAMEPTIHIGDRLYVYKWKVLVHRGDIIAFQPPLAGLSLSEHKATRKDFLKRVVGMPGDKVAIRNKKVFVNDTPLDEPYAIHQDT